MEVRLNDVIDAIEQMQDEDSAWYDPANGQIVWDSPDEREMERFIRLPDKYDRNDYLNMKRFIAGLDDEDEKDWLYNAITGQGAFRRFKAACTKFHILNDWYDFQDACHRDLAIDWCEAHGIVYRLDRDSDEDEEADDVSDFLQEDFLRPVEEEEEEPVPSVPFHVVALQEKNLQNALVVYDDYRHEVLRLPSDLQAAEEDLYHILSAGENVYAVSDHGRLIGIAICENTVDAIVLHDLYVMKDQRRNGVGHLLVNKVKQLAREADKPCLLYVPAISQACASFFVHEGWQPSKRMEMYLE